MFIVYYQTHNKDWCNGLCTNNFYDDGKVNYWMIPGTFFDTITTLNGE